MGNNRPKTEASTAIVWYLQFFEDLFSALFLGLRKMSLQQPTAGRLFVARVGTIGRLITLGLCVLGLGLVIQFGRRFVAWYARQSAATAIRAGRMTEAQEWLDWASWCLPQDGRVDVLRAARYRRLKDVEGFVKSLEQAKKKGAAAALIERERRLAMIQAGRLLPGPDNQIGLLIAQGYDSTATVEAFVYGALARGDTAQAWEIVLAWGTDLPDDPNHKYMAGIYWQISNNSDKAEEMQRAALRREPHHELAMLALAEILFADDRWEELYHLYEQWQRGIPRSEWAKIGLARMARLLGRRGEAQQWLNRPKLSAELSTAEIRETAELLLELERPAEAISWFERLNVERTTDRGLLHDLALAACFTADHLRAAELIDRADALFRKATRTHELQMRLVCDPQNEGLRSELASLLRNEPEPFSTSDRRGSTRRKPRSVVADADTQSLYTRYCAACHGEDGNGDGRAARFLFPRARNLRRDAFRIVSSEDGIPTVGDVIGVIREGMPGTAMRSFPELSEQESLQLAELVLEIFRDGIREQVLSIYAAEGENVSENEIQEEVLIRTTPGQRLAIPAIPPLDEQIAARGKEHYLTLGCANCHGVEGTGPCELALWDDHGFPNLPRDLKHDFFKGGGTPESLYLRLRLGMPGTAHPACPNATAEQLIEVVSYCRSLVQSPHRLTTNDQRWEESRARAWYPAYLNISAK